MKQTGPDDSLPQLDPPLRFLSMLWELNHALEVTSRKTSDALGVTAQQRLLLRIAGRFPELTAGALSRLLHIDPGTLSATLARLEERGLISRTRDPRDRRRVTVGLTVEGRAYDHPAEGTVESAVARLLSRAPEADVLAAQRCVHWLVQELADGGK